MRKQISLMCILAIGFLLIGCSYTENNLTNENPHDKKVSANREDSKQLVMLNGKLYSCTEKESSFELRCGNMDGKITSTVSQDDTPKENNQSNFGKGYGYQYGAQETQVEINIDGKWIVFEQVD